MNNDRQKIYQVTILSIAVLLQGLSNGYNINFYNLLAAAKHNNMITQNCISLSPSIYSVKPYNKKYQLQEVYFHSSIQRTSWSIYWHPLRIQMDSGECDGSHNPDLTESMGSDLHMDSRRDLTRVTVNLTIDNLQVSWSLKIVGKSTSGLAILLYTNNCSSYITAQGQHIYT